MWCQEKKMRSSGQLGLHVRQSWCAQNSLVRNALLDYNTTHTDYIHTHPMYKRIKRSRWTKHVQPSLLPVPTALLFLEPSYIAGCIYTTQWEPDRVTRFKLQEVCLVRVTGKTGLWCCLSRPGSEQNRPCGRWQQRSRRQSRQSPGEPGSLCGREQLSLPSAGIERKVTFKNGITRALVSSLKTPGHAE